MRLLPIVLLLACAALASLARAQSIHLEAEGVQEVNLYFNANLVYSSVLDLTGGASIDLSDYGQGTYIVDFDGGGMFALEAAGFDCAGGCDANAFMSGLHTFSLYEPLTCSSSEQRLRMVYDGLNSLQANETADAFNVLVSESGGGSTLLEYSGAGAWQSCVSSATCYDIEVTNNEADLESFLFTGRFTAALDETTHFILSGSWDWDQGLNSLTRTIGLCDVPSCSSGEQLLSVLLPEGAGFPGADGVYKRVEVVNGSLQQALVATGSSWWEPFAASIESTEVLAEGTGTLHACIASDACQSLGIVGGETGYWQSGSVNYGEAPVLLDGEPVKVYGSNWGETAYLPIGSCFAACSEGQIPWSISIDGASHITGQVLGGIESTAEINMDISGPGEWFGCMDASACYYVGFNFDLEAVSAGNPQNLQPGSVQVVVDGETVIDVTGNGQAHADWLSGNCSASPFGCTSPASQNYDPTAQINDGSCLTAFAATCDSTGNICYDNGWVEQEVLVVGTVTTGGAYFGLKGEMSDDYGSETDQIFLYDGVDPATSNLIASGNNFENGEVFFSPTGVVRATVTSSGSGSCGSTTNPYFAEHHGLDWAFSCSPIAYGCTDPAATNFNLSATHPVEGACAYDGCDHVGSWCNDLGYEEFEYVAPEGHWLVAEPVGEYTYEAYSQSLGWMNEEGYYLGEVNETIVSSEGYLKLEIYASDLADCNAPIEWTVNCIAEEDVVEGCSDPAASNYVADAIVQGVCVYEGCGATGSFCHWATENYVAEVQAVVTTGDGSPGQLTLTPGDMYFTDFRVYDGPDPASANVLFSYEQNPVVAYPDAIDLYSNSGVFAFEIMNVQSESGPGTASCEAGDALPWDWELVCGEVSGCTDPLYSEYNPEAQLNDGSCVTCQSGSVIEIVYDRADWPAVDLSWTLTRGDGSVVATDFVTTAVGEDVEPESWTIPICEAVATCYALTFEEFGFFPNGFEGDLSGVDGTASIFVDGQLAASITGNWGNSVEEVVLCTGGCTDSSAVNYDEQAPADNGSCIAQATCDEVGTFCTGINEDGTQIEAALAVPEGATGYLALQGLLHSGQDFIRVYSESTLSSDALLYEANWLFAESVYSPTGEFYVTFTSNDVRSCATGNLDPVNWQLTCEAPTFGCTDADAVNFDANASVDDGACAYDVCGESGQICLPNNLYPTSLLHFAHPEGLPIQLTLDGTMGNDFLLVSDQYNVMDAFFEDAPGINILATLGLNGQSQTVSNFQVTSSTGVLDLGISTGSTLSCADGDYAGMTWSVQCLSTGCTDAAACNYTPAAAEDDGSCAYTSDACGVCGGDGTSCTGCTDSSACNYEAGASNDDGSCAYSSFELTYTTDAAPATNSWALLDGSGNVAASGAPAPEAAFATVTEVACVNAGCYTFTVTDALGNGITGGSWQWADAGGEEASSGTWNGPFATFEEEVCLGLVSGCTNPLACNFDEAASLDDGTCAFGSVVVTVALDSYATETSWEVMDENEAVLATGGGYSYGDAFSTVTSSFCAQAGCYTFNLYDSWGDGMSGNEWSVSNDSGTLLSGTFSNGNAVGGEFCVAASVLGCTDEAACNYDPEATFDDGTCSFAGITISLNLDNYPGETSWTLVDDATGEVVSAGDGYTAQFAVVTESACLDFGCYTFSLFDDYGDGMPGEGWEVVDSEGNVLAEGTFSFGEVTSGSFCVIEPVEGCTDSEACNYNPNANIEDGSCGYAAVDLAFALDNYPGETAWNLQDDAGNLMASGSGYSTNYATVEESVCVAYGCYTFSLLDSYGDGISGSTWTVSSGGQILESGDFASGSSVVGEFCVIDGGGCTHPMACNYDDAATEDDGTCVFFVSDAAAVEEDFLIGALGFYTQFSGDYEDYAYACEAGIDAYGDFPLNFDGSGGANAPLTAVTTSATMGLIQTYIGMGWLPAELGPVLQGALFAGEWTVCGETMTVAIPGYPLLTGTFNGTAFVFPALGVYVAPASAVDAVCSDLAACNFQLCGVHDPALCVYPESGEDCEGNCLSDVDGDGICDAVTSASCGDPEAVNYDATVPEAFTVGCVYGSCYESDELCTFFPDLGPFIVHASPDGEPTYVRINSGTISHGYEVYDGLTPGSATLIAAEASGPLHTFSGELFVSQTGTITVWAVNPLNLETNVCALGGNDPLVWEAGCVGVGPDFCGDGMIWDPATATCQAPEDCLGDFNDDGVISASDLLSFLGVFGSECSDAFD